MRSEQPPLQEWSDRSFSQALASAPFALVTCDPGLRITSWNAGATRIFGHAATDAIGQQLEELLAPTRAPGWAEVLRDTSGAGWALRHARKDGRPAACKWVRQPILDEHGEVIGHLWVGQDVTRLAAELDRRKGMDTLLHAIHDRIQMVVWRVDPGGVFTYHEGKALASAGLAPGQYVGQNVFDLYPAEMLGFVRKALAGEAVSIMTEAHGVSWENWAVPVQDEEGRPSGAIGFALDVTDLRRAERDLQVKMEVVERQQEVIRELSTPILQVWEGVLALPLIGLIDSARTAAVMDSLLEAITRTHSRFAILDLTGVDAVDTQTAAYLLSLVRTIRLLGAEGILTGIRPHVAETVVGLGVSLEGVKTLANLQAGLRYCIARL